MAFTPHAYEDGKTVITAEIMKSIEDEIVALRNEMALASYPVGSIYMSTVNEDPGKKFGGRWQIWGSGRVPVCVDTTQTEFDITEKTGGSKYMQKHTHSTPNHKHTISVNTKELTGSMYNIASQSKGSAYGASGMCKVRQSKEKHGYASNSADGTTDGFTITATHNHAITQSSSGGGTSGSYGNGNAENMPPYITCYMFKRIE